VVKATFSSRISTTSLMNEVYASISQGWRSPHGLRSRSQSFPKNVLIEIELIAKSACSFFPPQSIECGRAGDRQVGRPKSFPLR